MTISEAHPPVRRALVTGGSGDIGGAICRRLARSGFAVLVHGYRNIDRAEQVVAEINAVTATQAQAQTINFDVSDTQAAKQALEEVLADGVVQVIVNNAAQYDDAPLAGMNASQWHGVIDVTLNSFYNVTQPLLLPMLAKRWGRIISVSSIAGVIGNRGQSNYAAAKAGLHGATKALALELASRNITVNAVAPGIIAGHITDNAFDRAAIKQLVPMKRAGTPEEVAALVDFLASDEAGFISGQVININGAMA